MKECIRGYRILPFPIEVAGHLVHSYLTRSRSYRRLIALIRSSAYRAIHSQYACKVFLSGIAPCASSWLENKHDGSSLTVRPNSSQKTTSNRNWSSVCSILRQLAFIDPGHSQERSLTSSKVRMLMQDADVPAFTQREHGRKSLHLIFEALQDTHATKVLLRHAALRAFWMS